MCGIYGSFSRNGESISRKTLEQMDSLLRHRGPDGSGIYMSGPVALGNRRLAILDIEHGQQPFVADDGSVSVVQNGEIFNYIELAQELASLGFPCRTHCDTEVILRGFQCWGIEIVNRLNGMFAIAIFDARREILYLIRDRAGVKPLYYHENSAGILFASEIKALLAAGVQAEVDLRAIDDLLTFNYVPPPATAYRGVFHVPPATIATITRGATKIRRWWRLPPTNSGVVNEEEAAEEMMSILSDSVRIRMRSDVPFGALLSGGLDSSTIVGLMARTTNAPIQTFAIGFNDPRFDESSFALMAAKRFGTQHQSQYFVPEGLNRWPTISYFNDQPHGDVSFLPTFQVAELASRHVKVVLTGDGGDELFAGYEKYLPFATRAQSGEDFLPSYLASISLLSPVEKARLYSDSFAQAVDGNDPYRVVTHVLQQDLGLDPINQMLAIDFLLLLPGNNLVKPDRMGMAHSIEARTPFLDYRMIEFAFRLPGWAKLREGCTKYIMRRGIASLIGTELLNRKKQMFTVPIGEWFKSDQGRLCRELLCAGDSFAARLFRADAIERMISDHCEGRHNFTRQLRALAAIEVWRTSMPIVPQLPL